MRERVIKRGVLLAAVLAVGTVATNAQSAPLPLKPSVLDDVGATADAVPVKNVVLSIDEEETVVRPKKKKIIVDAYAPSGIDTGGVRLYPSLEIGGVFTSNVAQSGTIPKSDFGLRLRPSLRFETDWSRHRWTGQMSAEVLRYLSDPNLSTLTGSADTNFRLDIRHTTHADFSANFTANNTGLGDSSVPGNALEPRRDKNFGIGADLVHDFGKLEGSVKLAIARSVYDNVALVGGGTEQNADRNYIEPSLALRATLGDSVSRLRPFAEIAYAPRIHDQTIDDNGQKRDSQGLAGTVGFSFADDPIWQGDVALTYLVRNYADPALSSNSAFGLRGRVQWSPVAPLKLEAVSGVDLGETASVGIGGTKSWNAGLNLTYALHENINLLAGVGYTRGDVGTSVTSNKTVRAGFEWALNPNMSAALMYQGAWYDDGVTLGAGDYSEQRVMTSIVLKR